MSCKFLITIGSSPICSVESRWRHECWETHASLKLISWLLPWCNGIHRFTHTFSFTGSCSRWKRCRSRVKQKRRQKKGKQRTATNRRNKARSSFHRPCDHRAAPLFCLSVFTDNLWSQRFSVITVPPGEKCRYEDAKLVAAFVHNSGECGTRL